MRLLNVAALGACLACCASLCGGCSTTDQRQPSTVTVPTDVAQRAGQGPVEADQYGWNSAGERTGDDWSDRRDAKLAVPMRNPDGTIVLDGNGVPVTLTYDGPGLRDFYFINVEGGGHGIDAHMEQQVGGTTTGTAQTGSGSGSQTATPGATATPTNTVTPNTQITPRGTGTPTPTPTPAPPQ